MTAVGPPLRWTCDPCHRYLAIPKQRFDQFDVGEWIVLVLVAGIGVAGVLGVTVVAWWLALR